MAVSAPMSSVSYGGGKSRDLTALMDRYLGGPGVQLYGIGPASRAMHDIFQSEQVTSPLIATTFWQAFIESPGYARALWKGGASHTSVFQGERYIVAHGSGWPRQDLVIFDPSHTASEPIVVTIQPEPDELIEGWERFRHRMGLSDPDFRVRGLAAVEASLAQPFGVVVAPSPPTVYARCPSPPWPVAPAGIAVGGASTAGVVVKNHRNQIGVTAALHGLASAKQAMVANQLCSVVSEDVVSDSCFIEVPGCALPPKSGLAGPLRGVTPRVLDPVTFEGITSSQANTIVTSWSPDLPFVLPYSQLKVLTKPDTNPGDSGAALIDSGDHILGFAFYRTGFGAPIEYAAWIWADCVFQAHHLSTI